MKIFVLLAREHVELKELHILLGVRGLARAHVQHEQQGGALHGPERAAVARRRAGARLLVGGLMLVQRSRMSSAREAVETLPRSRAACAVVGEQPTCWSERFLEPRELHDGRVHVLVAGRALAGDSVRDEVVSPSRFSFSVASARLSAMLVRTGRAKIGYADADRKL